VKPCNQTRRIFIKDYRRSFLRPMQNRRISTRTDLLGRVMTRQRAMREAVMG
jgi:hypothetical protein